MDFLITFTGHIDERKRPENFPHKIYDLLLIAADNKDGVVKAINDYSKNYIRNGGMSVRIDPYAQEDPSVLDTDRMFVPLHMLTYFTADVKQISGEIAGVDLAGSASMPSGKAVVKN
jgi:hypothetical protein